VEVEVDSCLAYICNRLITFFFCRVDELLDELRTDTTSNGLEYIVFLRALKVWKLTSSYVIFNVSQTLKHPCLTSGWISCLYIHLQKALCQTCACTFC